MDDRREGCGHPPPLVVDGVAGGGLSPQIFIRFGNEVLFNGLGSNGQPGLWVTDGTGPGTSELSVQAAPGGDGSFLAGPAVYSLNTPNGGLPGGTTADMIMNNTTRGSMGQYEIYNIGGNAVLAAYPLGQVGAPWTFAGVGTFQAGDSDDMLLRNSSTGAFDAYYISGNSITGTALIGTVGLSWNYAGTGDFDGASSLSELLLRDSRQRLVRTVSDRRGWGSLGELRCRSRQQLFGQGVRFLL